MEILRNLHIAFWLKIPGLLGNFYHGKIISNQFPLQNAYFEDFTL
jgi:hypothetical protein